MSKNIYFVLSVAFGIAIQCGIAKSQEDFTANDALHEKRLYRQICTLLDNGYSVQNVEDRVTNHILQTEYPLNREPELQPFDEMTAGISAKVKMFHAMSFYCPHHDFPEQ